MPITQSGMPAVSGHRFDSREQNEAVTRWASMVQRRLRDRTSSLMYSKQASTNRPGRTEKKLEDSIKTITKKSYSVIDRVTYTFERHGVFVHKGVGRGYQMQGGMVVRTAKCEDPATRQPTWGGDDPRPRLPNEWFNPLLEQTLPELADNWLKLMLMRC